MAHTTRETDPLIHSQNPEHSGDFPDFGSLDALEATLAAAEGLGLHPRHPSHQVNCSQAKLMKAIDPLAFGRGPAGVRHEQRLEQPPPWQQRTMESRRGVFSGATGYQRMAEVVDPLALAGESADSNGQHRRRQTQALEKLVNLLEAIAHALDANGGMNNPFQFGP